MIGLRESLLDDEDIQINDLEAVLGIKAIKDYLSNPRIKLYPNFLLDFVLYADFEKTLTYKENPIYFVNHFRDVIGDYPGWIETAEWVLNTYLKYQRSKTSDSIFMAVGLYDPETYEGLKHIDKKYINKIFKNNSQAFKNYIDNLDAPAIMTKYKNEIDEFVMFDDGPGWDSYIFCWIPKKATLLEKEILRLMFNTSLKIVRK